MRNLSFLFILILFHGLRSVGQVFHSNRADLEKQRASIQKEIENVKLSLDINHKNRKENLGQLVLLQKRLRLREASMDNINQQLNFIHQDMHHSWLEIVKLEKELDTLRQQYAQSVIYAYKNRTNFDFLNFIFAASNFNDAMMRFEYLKSYRAYREQRAENILRTEVLLQTKIDELKIKRVEKDGALAKQSLEKRSLEMEKKEKDEAIAHLQKNEKELKKEIVTKQRQDLKLANAITMAIRRARTEAIREAKANTAATVNSKKASASLGKTEAATNSLTAKSAGKSSTQPLFITTKDLELSGNFEKDKGRLPWPVPSGTISIPFGPHEVIKGIMHNSIGITIESSPGSLVTSVSEGEVQSVFNVEDMSVVMIRHGKYFTTYANLSTANVSKGQTVKRGQVLGKLAKNGQLDFVISDDLDHHFDPERWLKK